MATKTIDDVIYITVPDTSGCDGCVAQGVQGLCYKLTSDTDGTSICAREGSIWIKWAAAQDKPAIAQQPMTTNTIDGITYFDAPETDDYDGCVGCVAQSNPPLCAKLRQTGGSYNYCTDHNVIWILPQAKPANTISTPSGMFQQAPVEGRRPCQGCAAQLDGNLCLEIAEQHACIETPKQIWIKAQQPAPNIPEVLLIIQEEAAEVIQAVSKVQRFGLDNHHPELTKTNKQELEEELGDLLAMVEILTNSGYLDPKAVQAHAEQKTQKLKQYSTVWTSKPIN